MTGVCKEALQSEDIAYAEAWMWEKKKKGTHLLPLSRWQAKITVQCLLPVKSWNDEIKRRKEGKRKNGRDGGRRKRGNKEGRCAYAALLKNQKKDSYQMVGVPERLKVAGTGPKRKSKAQSPGGTSSTALWQHQACSLLSDGGGGKEEVQGQPPGDELEHPSDSGWACRSCVFSHSHAHSRERVGGRGRHPSNRESQLHN